MKKNTPSPFRKVLREQRRIVLWGIYHAFTIGCFALGLYYCREYMFLPDRVLLIDNSGSLYTGKSTNILCHAVADDMARRAAFAFLDRGYEHENRAQCEAIFGRTAQKALFGVIGESKDEFSEQKIRQFPEIGQVTILPAAEAGQCLVWVEGILHRTGIYMEIPYYQKLEFELGLRLMRSEKPEEFPLRVLRMTYGERSIYNNKTPNGAKTK